MFLDPFRDRLRLAYRVMEDISGDGQTFDIQLHDCFRLMRTCRDMLSDLEQEDLEAREIRIGLLMLEGALDSLDKCVETLCKAADSVNGES